LHVVATDAKEPFAASEGASATPVEYSQSAGLAARLAALDVALAFSSYQSGLLYLLGRKPDGSLHLHQTAIAKPMGITCDGPGRLTLAAGYQILRLASPLAPQERVNEIFDACYVPRRVHVTGELDAHDIGIDAAGQPVFVNTQYNCLATVDDQHSFRALWMPPFITDLVREDRCHLNGLAMRAGRPAYVTAVSRSNTIDGWRDRRADGGVVIDVERNAVICEGLSMPHSPRLHGGELWVMNSGTGELGIVEGAATGKGRFVPRVFCPGFLRGLAFRGQYAFVGLSKPRYKRFEGLALEARLAAADSAPWCGVQVIDLARGTCVDWFRIDGSVAELYDVAAIPGVACPMALGPGSPELINFVTHGPAPETALSATPPFNTSDSQETA